MASGDRVKLPFGLKAIGSYLKVDSVDASSSPVALNLAKKGDNTNVIVSCQTSGTQRGTVTFSAYEITEESEMPEFVEIEDGDETVYVMHHCLLYLSGYFDRNSLQSILNSHPFNGFCSIEDDDYKYTFFLLKSVFDSSSFNAPTDSDTITSWWSSANQLARYILNIKGIKGIPTLEAKNAGVDDGFDSFFGANRQPEFATDHTGRLVERSGSNYVMKGGAHLTYNPVKMNTVSGTTVQDANTLLMSAELYRIAIRKQDKSLQCEETNDLTSMPLSNFPMKLIAYYGFVPVYEELIESPKIVTAGKAIRGRSIGINFYWVLKRNGQKCTGGAYGSARSLPTNSAYSSRGGVRNAQIVYGDTRVNLADCKRAPSKSEGGFYIEFTPNRDPNYLDQRYVLAVKKDIYIPIRTNFTYGHDEDYYESMEKQVNGEWVDAEWITDSEVQNEIRVRIKVNHEVKRVRSDQQVCFLITMNSQYQDYSFSPANVTINLRIGRRIEFQTKPISLDEAPKQGYFAVTIDTEGKESNETIQAYLTKNALDSNPKWEECELSAIHDFSDDIVENPAIAGKLIVSGDIGDPFKIKNYGIGIF